MTLDELKKTGKDGVYRADLDEYFPVGEEPPLVVESSKLPETVKPEPELKPTPEPEQPEAAAAAKPTKVGKNNG